MLFFLTMYYEKISLENYPQKLKSATFYDFLKRALEYEEITGKQISCVFYKKHLPKQIMQYKN